MYDLVGDVAGVGPGDEAEPRQDAGEKPEDGELGRAVKLFEIAAEPPEEHERPDERPDAERPVFDGMQEEGGDEAPDLAVRELRGFEIEGAVEFAGHGVRQDEREQEARRRREDQEFADGAFAEDRVNGMTTVVSVVIPIVDAHNRDDPCRTCSDACEPSRTLADSTGEGKASPVSWSELPSLLSCEPAADRIRTNDASKRASWEARSTTDHDCGWRNVVRSCRRIATPGKPSGRGPIV